MKEPRIFLQMAVGCITPCVTARMALAVVIFTMPTSMTGYGVTRRIAANASIPANWDSQPSVSSDGRHLFFLPPTDRVVRGSDIWMSTLGDDGYWGPAQNPSPEINTPGEDNSPFIHPDGNTLYFASDGHPGMGGLDLFTADGIR